MLRRSVSAVALAFVAVLAATPFARAQTVSPFSQLGAAIRSLAQRVPAPTAFELVDLSTGQRAGYNAGVSMPAASTIKIPVMVEVFRQLEDGRFDLEHRVTLLGSDKDYGSGELCDASAGSTHTVAELLEKMIDISDNTATNMLIRLVGRSNINAEMEQLGLDRTRLTGDVRTGDWGIRKRLRTSAADLSRLLAMMARRELVDEWSSNEMIAILEQDQYNTLIPEPLPDDVLVAHKTGSFFDTLNDAGIVYADGAPYVITVMTTALPYQDLGRSFIHTVSKLAYAGEMRFARWRQASGFAPIPGLTAPTGSSSPDLRYWSTGLENVGSGGGGGGGR